MRSPLAEASKTFASLALRVAGRLALMTYHAAMWRQPGGWAAKNFQAFRFLLNSASLPGSTRYAKCVGLAFQVVDDVLDEESDSATLGKTAGKDRQAGKPTFTSFLGVAEAKSFAADLLAQARDALAGFDVRADRLRQLADFIVQRNR